MVINEQVLDSIMVDALPEYYDSLTQYAEFVDVKQGELNDVKTLMDLLKEQALVTLREVHRLRGEKPVGIYFWKNPVPEIANYFVPMKPNHDRYGWGAWTDRKRQTLEPPRYSSRVSP